MHRVLVVNQREVAGLLPMPACIEAMAAALVALAQGEAAMPLRQIVWRPDRTGALGLMPSRLEQDGGPGSLGAKIVTFFPKNEGTELDSHQGAVLLFEAERGRLMAVIDATSVTAIRTAAVSAVATRALARPDAGDLALVGSGVQAHTHLEAIRAVRPLSRVRVASLTPERAQAFARRESERLGLPVTACATVREAVEGAVGSSVAAARELDTAAVVRSRLFVDRRESALAEAGDFVIPRSEGAVTDAHIQAELGEVLTGAHPGRTARDEITLFKSVGLAVEDLAAARLIDASARAAGAGTLVEFGGGRDAFERAP
jgi:ornithine cyclodeaminase